MSIQDQQDAQTPSETKASAPEAAPAPERRWDTLGLSDEALRLIEKAGFKQPTPVQTEAIPIALSGEDLIASAQTGTGKTATFVLPMAERFAGKEGTYGLVLCPTREIAQQTQQTLELFAAPRGLRSVVLIGGIDMKIDAAALATYPQIIVATPGRLCDHLDRGNVWLDFIQVVVLDEADRMLDMGFSDQINRIMEDVPKDRQTLLFSATIPPMVEKLANKILHEPKRVAIGRTSSTATTVDQRFKFMKEEDKPRMLRRALQDEKGSIIVFTRSKDGATRVWRSLHSAGVYDATYIHSDRLQSHREQALAEFKEGKYRILIATDVAGRGIHVDDVAHVINYDLPMEAEDYVHRIGRTGRAGQTGKATTFITPRDRMTVRQIEKLTGLKIGTYDDHASERDSGREGGRDGGRRDGGHRGGRDNRGPRVEHGQQERAQSGAVAAGTISEGQVTAPSQAQGESAQLPREGGENNRRRRRRGRGGQGGGSGENRGPRHGAPAQGGDRPAFPIDDTPVGLQQGALSATSPLRAEDRPMSDDGNEGGEGRGPGNGGGGKRRRRGRRGGRGRRGNGGGAGGGDNGGGSPTTPTGAES